MKPMDLLVLMTFTDEVLRVAHFIESAPIESFKEMCVPPADVPQEVLDMVTPEMNEANATLLEVCDALLEIRPRVIAAKAKFDAMMDAKKQGFQRRN